MEIAVSDEQGTDLYRRAMAHDYGDGVRDALMHKVWSPTPWMVDVYEGPHDEMRYYDMILWCRENLGDESYPIHDKTGVWARGGVTIHGWTWWGFATEDLMNKFLAAWPQQALEADAP